MAFGTHTSAMNQLIQRLTRLPGIGRRSAERLAYHLLKQPPDEAQALAEAILNLKHNVKTCRVCFNLTESDPCPICSDTRRDQAIVMVVEQPGDVVALESTALYQGVYHVLMGRLSPLDGVGPGEINAQALFTRAQSGHIREVILGTQPTLEGDGTALYLTDKLKHLGVKVTRLARGLPTGVNLDIVSKAVLADAIEGRQNVTGNDP
jgi:recombination protein RecR